MVAEREDHAVGVPVEVGVEHAARGQFPGEDQFLLGERAPVLDDGESRPRMGEAPEVLVDHVVEARVGNVALHAEEAVELKVGMGEENPTAKTAHDLLDNRALGGRLGGGGPLRIDRHLLRETFRLRLVRGDGLRHVLVRAAAEGERVVEGRPRAARRQTRRYKRHRCNAAENFVIYVKHEKSISHPNRSLNCS